MTYFLTQDWHELERASESAWSDVQLLVDDSVVTLRNDHLSISDWLVGINGPEPYLPGT